MPVIFQIAGNYLGSANFAKPSIGHFGTMSARAADGNKSLKIVVRTRPTFYQEYQSFGADV
jgi:hypothetical protein